MNEPTEFYLLCPPEKVADRYEIGILTFIEKPGSIVGECCKCGMLIWIGPAQLVKQKEHPEAKAICFKCAVNLPECKPENIKAVAQDGASYGIDETWTPDRLKR